LNPDELVALFKQIPFGGVDITLGIHIDLFLVHYRVGEK